VVADNVGKLKHISGMDEVSFHMSGTEAVMQAVRLARYHTQRSHLVRFCGAYHGWWDDVQPGVGTPRTVRETYTLKEMDQATLRVLETAHRHRLRAGEPAAVAAPNAAAPAMLRWSAAIAARALTGLPTRRGCGNCARVHGARDSP